jgi:hypothetical protein
MTPKFFTHYGVDMDLLPPDLSFNKTKSEIHWIGGPVGDDLIPCTFWERPVVPHPGGMVAGSAAPWNLPDGTSK